MGNGGVCASLCTDANQVGLCGYDKIIAFNSTNEIARFRVKCSNSNFMLHEALQPRLLSQASAIRKITKIAFIVIFLTSLFFLVFLRNGGNTLILSSQWWFSVSTGF